MKRQLVRWTRVLLAGLVLVGSGCGPAPEGSGGELELTASALTSATLSFVATEDARVEEAQPGASFGAAGLVTSSASGARQEVYLKFQVGGLPAGAVVHRATLELWCVDGSTNGPKVRRAASSGWSEAGLTWATRPGAAAGAAAFGDLGNTGACSPTAPGLRTLNVTPDVTGNGTVSLVLVADAADAFGALSRESAGREPRLVVAYGDPILVGAGDISQPGSSADDDTARLLDGIGGTVFALGDNAYNDGTLSEFRTNYEPSWGRHKARTRPIPGNHEYHTANAQGYVDYFGALGGPVGKFYYSYDVGNWHVVALNTNIATAAGSEQERWLRADLAANTRPCLAAYFHHPLFSSGEHGNASVSRPLWNALYEHRADLVLNGHDHDYERFAPLAPNGSADPVNGIREFVVGTGGTSLRAFGAVKAHSEVRYNATQGILKLVLHEGSYEWEFIPTSGAFRDMGSAACHRAGSPPPPPPPPPAPGCVTAAANAAWLNTPLAPQTGRFTFEVDATPARVEDAVIGLSLGAQSGYAGFAALVRFNGTGTLDARSGGAYQAASAIPYAAGTRYHLRLVVDVGTRTYSAHVTPAGGTERVIGTGLAFRTEQSALTRLDSWGAKLGAGTLGSLTLCNPGVTAEGSPPPAPVPTCGTASAGAGWLNTPFAPQTGRFSAEFDATPSAVEDTVVGLSRGAQTAYSGFAALVRFNGTGTLDARSGGAYQAAASIPYTAGSRYHFRLVVDVPAHSYSAYVTPAGGTERVIGTGLAFRTEQQAVGGLDSWGAALGAGATRSTQVCGFRVAPAP